MFKLIKQQEIKDLEITYFEFEHEKTKAKHIHLKADDNENGFLCGFKTLPYSDNGIMHILEHSVLAGSRDFPMNDPLMSIIKKSLQTYTNATTTSDCTYYPFATQNKKDFFNLMHVYTNAIFFPLLRKETFLQEGWRFEFSEPTNPKSELITTGVVFNEMMGIMSNHHSHFWEHILKHLYPDTKYAYNSGGDPKAIPSLTHQEFCDYHKKYYHPSNAVFLTYGDIDYSEIQNKLEELCLNEFDYSEVVIDNPSQEPFKEAKKIVTEYPYKEDDFAEKHFYLKMWNITDITDPEKSYTTSFINSLLDSDSSSVMRKALDDSKLMITPLCFSADNNRDVFLLIGGEGVKEENFEKLDKLITETLNEIIKTKFDKTHIEKELHQLEINQKTKSEGRTTYGLNLLSVVLEYANNNLDGTIPLNPDVMLYKLKENLKDENFLTDFIKENIINNNHAITLALKASNKLALQEEEIIKNIAKNKQNNLTEAETQEILDNFKALEVYQDKSKQQGSLPDFSIKDIPLEKEMQELETINYKDKTIYAFKAPTSGLTYYSRHCFIEGLKASDAEYLNIYNTLISQVGIGELDYKQISEYENSICSGIRSSLNFTEDRYDAEKIYVKFALGSRMLHKNRAKVKTLMDDFIFKLRLDEKDHIIKQLKKYNNHLQNSFHTNGHKVAIEMAKSKISKIDYFDNKFDGIEFCLFFKSLMEKIEDDSVYDNLINKISEIHKKVQKAYKQSILSVIDLEESLLESVEIFFDDNVVSEPIKHPIVYDLDDYNSNMLLTNKTNSNYCAMVMSAPYLDHELAGAYSVLGKIISNEFTHTEIREKGGAYGGFASYQASSESFVLASYWDPNISKTFETFKKLDKWLLDESNITDEEIEQGILQVIAQVDCPTLKVKKCSNALSRYFDQLPNEDLIKHREKILKTDMAQIRRVINELLIPNLKNAVYSGLVNKDQYLKENLNFNTIEF